MAGVGYAVVDEIFGVANEKFLNAGE